MRKIWFFFQCNKFFYFSVWHKKGWCWPVPWCWDGQAGCWSPRCWGWACPRGSVLTGWARRTAPLPTPALVLRKILIKKFTQPRCLNHLKDSKNVTQRVLNDLYRGPGFLVVVWLGSCPNPPLTLASCPSFPFFLYVVRRVVLHSTDGRGEGVGEEPNHTTARKPDPPLIIQYSLMSLKWNRIANRETLAMI